MARVLVVDDNVDAGETLVEALGMLGHEAKLVGDGQSALDATDTWKPRAVLLDLGLPDLDGIEVAKRLGKTPARSGVFLVALTGYGSAEDKRATREAGFDAHVVKPVDFDELEKLLADASVLP